MHNNFGHYFCCCHSNILGRFFDSLCMCRLCVLLCDSASCVMAKFIFYWRGTWRSMEMELPSDCQYLTEYPTAHTWVEGSPVCSGTHFSELILIKLFDSRTLVNIQRLTIIYFFFTLALITPQSHWSSQCFVAIRKKFFQTKFPM